MSTYSTRICTESVVLIICSSSIIAIYCNQELVFLLNNMPQMVCLQYVFVQMQFVSTIMSPVEGVVWVIC